MAGVDTRTVARTLRWLVTINPRMLSGHWQGPSTAEQDTQLKVAVRNNRAFFVTSCHPFSLFYSLGSL
eukprot:scaffold10861_cov180-Amphora_coffeaeformis.AAC.46